MAQNNFLNVDTDALDEIYQFNPAFSNLYTLELFTLKPSGGTEIADTEMRDMFRYHATRITLNGESLTMKRNDITKRFQLEANAYKRTDQVSVTIRENEKWQVKKYHEYWLSLFYNKESDCYLSKDLSRLQQYQLYRLLKIYFPKTSETNDCIVMTILPTNTGDISLGWGNSSEVISHNLTYNVEKWWWEKSSKSTLSSNNFGASSNFDANFVKY